MPVEAKVEIEREGGLPTSSDYAMAAYAAELLEQEYPFRKHGAAWAVRYDSEQGVMMIKDVTDLSPYWHVLHLSKFVTYDMARKKILHAGGEILERTLEREDREGIRMVLQVDRIPEKDQPKHAAIFDDVEHEDSLIVLK